MADIPEGSVIITPSQVYDKVNLLTDEVTKLLARDDAGQERRTTDARRLDAMEARLTSVEKKLLLLSGAAAALGAGVGSWLPTVLR